MHVFYVNCDFVKWLLELCELCEFVLFSVFIVFDCDISNICCSVTPADIKKSRLIVLSL